MQGRECLRRAKVEGNHAGQELMLPAAKRTAAWGSSSRRNQEGDGMNPDRRSCLEALRREAGKRPRIGGKICSLRLSPLLGAGSTIRKTAKVGGSGLKTIRPGNNSD